MYTFNFFLCLCFHPQTIPDAGADDEYDSGSLSVSSLGDSSSGPAHHQPSGPTPAWVMSGIRIFIIIT